MVIDMKLSKYFIPTLKEVTAEVQMPSHKLMVRSGMVRQLAAGVFSWLPVGHIVLKKVMNILREEIDKIGGQEFLLPALNPIDIWEETNRVEAMGDVMFHIKNRDGLILAPTHEEVITYHARQHVKSYRDMPMVWYQIQTKFRNEPRPKSGVLRGRQFIMKDAYSLDSTWEGLDISYQNHYEAYSNIFNRCGIKFFVVGASSGAMGGKQSQEFMVESEAGEDLCVISDSGYAANIEVATSNIAPVGRIDNNPEIEIFATPNAKSIDDLVEQFAIPEERCAKSVVYMVEDKPVIILMRGNDELNENKLESVLGTNVFRAATSDELIRFTGADGGSIGPVNLKTKVRVIADNLLKDANGMVSGANQDGFHYKNIDLARDTQISEFYDLRTVKEGEPNPIDGTPVRIVKAIELGHIFKLGTRYSDAMGATFLDADGKENPIIMGSYGIGVERVIACFIEQNYDDYGIKWNKELTPFHAHIVGLNTKKAEDVREVCDKFYSDLKAAGLDALYDDRDDSVGVKFNDADLLGVPVQIVVGSKNLANGQVELKYRLSGEKQLVKIKDVITIVKDYYTTI